MNNMFLNLTDINDFLTYRYKFFLNGFIEFVEQFRE